jgi:alanyl-tRNA synthetase
LSVAGHVAKRLYFDSDELEFEARVTDIRLNSTVAGEGGEKQQLWQVALDRTAFYPECGGQPWDTGVLVATSRGGATLEVPVERVEEDALGEVWHFIRKPLLEGAEVVGRVDAERRMDHMQQHSGQHVLSAIFLREMGARTVSFHLGAEYSTIDLDVKERPTEDELRRVEEAVNRVVYDLRPMIPHWVEREYAEEMLRRGDLRKLPEREGRIRIVQMQGIEFNACGGTHARSTGEIGSIALRRLEKVKQGWRVEFCCGLRAVRAARRDFELLSGVARTLSVGAGDLPARVEKLLEEKNAAAKEVKKLSAELAAKAAQVRTINSQGE